MCEKYLEYETKLIHLQLMRITPADAGKTRRRERGGRGIPRITSADAGKTNRLYYTFIRQKKQHMTFSVILSVHYKY